MTASNASLRQLRAFIEVADRGSFIAASQSLNMSQPALSHCIRQLEGHVGSALFNRSTRHVHLTPLGIGFLPMARDIVNRFDSLMSDVQDAVNHKHGNVTVACLPSVASRLMPRVLVACDRQYPGIHVTIRDANMKGVSSMILSGEADFGIASGIAPDANLGSAGFAWDKIYAVLPVTAPLARKRSLHWQDLEGSPFIAMSHETGIRDLVDHTVRDLGVVLNITNEVSNLATLSGLIEEGVGISAAPELALPRDNQSLVRRRPLIEPVIRRTISLLWKRGQGLSPAASALVSSLESCISSGEMKRYFPDVDWEDSVLDSKNFV
nr:LysR substrate-binding domain-containing protein [uncultured Cohaesibacter sp.]